MKNKDDFETSTKDGCLIIESLQLWETSTGDKSFQIKLPSGRIIKEGSKVGNYFAKDVTQDGNALLAIRAHERVIFPLATFEPIEDEKKDIKLVDNKKDNDTLTAWKHSQKEQ